MKTNTQLRGRIMRKHRWTVWGLFGLLVALLMHSVTNVTEARNANFKLCFPFGLATPTMDGLVTNDLGWDNGFRYVFENGTPKVDGAVQGVRTSTDLYLSFEIKNEITFDDDDLLVIAIDPDGAVGNFRRIHIYPVFNGVGAAASGVPRAVDYWKGTAGTAATPTGAWGASTVNPAWLEVKVKHIGAESSPPADPLSWSVEVRIPIKASAAALDGINIPPSGLFGLYVNAIRVDRVTLSNKAQNAWPPNTPIILGAAEVSTPIHDKWGNATIDPAGGCKGVSFTHNDISTNQVPNTKIALDRENIFTVKMTNSSVDGAGVGVSAQDVTALFRIKNFGLPPASPALWAPINTSPNPSLKVTIPAGGTETAQIKWTLSPPERALYDTPAARNQCIRVELDSTVPQTLFINRTAWSNMFFGLASRFSQSAEISGLGYGPPPGGRSKHRFDLLVTSTEEVFPQDQAARLALKAPTLPTMRPNQVLTRLTYILHGCRYTGDTIEINGHTYNVCERVGSYGFIVDHIGDRVDKWLQALVGQGLKPIGRNQFRIEIPQDGSAQVTTRLEPVETGQSIGNLAVFADLGASFPHGILNTFFDSGLSFNGGLEYSATNYISIEGVFGAHHFGNSFAGSSDLNLFQFSGVGKAYLTAPGPLRPFVNVGIGAYKSDPGDTRFGANIGTGLQFNIAPKFAVEGAYNFHSVFTPGTNFKFSALQGGVRFRF